VPVLHLGLLASSPFRSTLQNHHSTPKLNHSVDTASVIVTFMVTFRVLPRSTLETSSDLRALSLSIARRANVNFFAFNQFHTLASLFCTRAFDNSFAINTFRTLLQNPGEWVYPQEFVSCFQGVTHSSRTGDSTQQGMLILMTSRKPVRSVHEPDRSHYLLGVAGVPAMAGPPSSPRPDLSVTRREAIVAPLLSRWSPVVFQRKSPSISFPFIS
jgi:hypothetical protein